MKYIVLERKDSSRLEEDVNAYLAQGWKLQGGVCMTYCGLDGDDFRTYWHSQALVLPQSSEAATRGPDNE